MKRSNSNLPNNHGILVGALLALLGEQGGKLGGAIDEEPIRDPVNGLIPPILKGRGSMPLFGGVASALPER